MEVSNPISTGKSAIPIIVAVIVGLISFFLVLGTAWGIAFAEKKNHQGDAPSMSGSGGSGELTCPPGLNAAEIATCLENYLKKVTPGSPFIGHMEVFVQTSIKYNVNPGFMLAISGQESTFDEAYKNRPNNRYYNFCNRGHWEINDEGKRIFIPDHFSSFEQGMDKCISNIRTHYLDGGFTQLDERFSGEYCGGASEGCGGWLKGVTKFFTDILAACPKLQSVSSSVVANAEGGVILDPGHGEGGDDGCDRGYIGPGTECGNNFTVASKVKALLEAKGVKAAMTKSSASQNLGRPERVRIANASKAAIFVSLHSNSESGTQIIGIISCPSITSSKKGISYQDDNTCPNAPYLSQSKALSRNIVTHIKSGMGFSSTTYWATGELGVFHGLKMPGVLVEMFRHDNRGDVNMYTGKEDIMAQSIASGILVSLGK